MGQLLVVAEWIVILLIGWAFAIQCWKIVAGRRKEALEELEEMEERRDAAEISKKAADMWANDEEVK